MNGFTNERLCFFLHHLCCVFTPGGGGPCRVPGETAAPASSQRSRRDLRNLLSLIHLKDSMRACPLQSPSEHKHQFEGAQKQTPEALMQKMAPFFLDAPGPALNPPPPSTLRLCVRVPSGPAETKISPGMKSPALICCSNRSQTEGCTERPLSHYAPHEPACSSARQVNAATRKSTHEWRTGEGLGFSGG